MHTIEIVEESEYKKPVLLDDIQRITAYLKAVVPYQNTEDYLFDYFYQQYKAKSMDWGELEEAIDTLSGFASGKGSEVIDREIFHHLGFLIYAGGRLYDLYQKWLDCGGKTEFSHYLFTQVQKRIRSSLQNRNIEKLTYHDSRATLQNLLLLFNLAYLVADQSSNVYFKFNRFVLEEWSLEHIYVQKSQSVYPTKEMPQTKENEDKIKDWIKEVLKYLKNIQLKKKIDLSLKRVGKDFFNYLGNHKLLGRIDADFTDRLELHHVQNLTLLDKQTNQAIGNLIFKYKCKQIEKRKNQDKLIPICTQKVFEKAFSQNTDTPDLFTIQDQEDYLEKIKEYLKKYGIDKDNA
ncbi:hypothetical protein [Helicobacter sp. L8]|uniref:hypothetical protein n=1 Tax=Helicobacter sp. L8 TaxID=2316078 RepID=UPI001F09C9F6|nr:hypothetical protein [Helicobacter sp. L8]